MISAVVAMMLNAALQDIVIRLTSLVAAIVLLAQMIFQIDYFSVSQWAVECKVNENNNFVLLSSSYLLFRIPIVSIHIQRWLKLVNYFQVLLLCIDFCTRIRLIYYFRAKIMVPISWMVLIGWEFIKLVTGRYCSYYPVMFVCIAVIFYWCECDKLSVNNFFFLIYSGIIIAVTMHVVVVTRQKYMRHVKGCPLSRSPVLFPRISYREANNGVLECIQYLFNYGFFRFGIEVKF